MGSKQPRPDWLDEIEQLAEDVLGQQTNSACDQVHPIIKAWYEKTLYEDPPPARDSVWQALSCLTTEVMSDMPDGIFDVLSASADEDDVALWVYHILLVGRNLEISLRDGRLDDL